MAQAVLQMLRVHPLLDPLREAGVPILVSCHTRAPGPWSAHRPTRDQFEVRVEVPEWREPSLYTFADHARRLAGYLAWEVRSEWDAKRQA